MSFRTHNGIILNEGDIVECTTFIYHDPFSGQGIYRGPSYTDSSCIAIERMDGVNGGAQNRWWNFKIDDIQYLLATGGNLMMNGGSIAGPIGISSYEIQEKQKKEDSQKKTINLSKLDALIIKPEVKEEIIALLKQRQHQDKIFKEWGLGETIEYGRGMTLLFYGKPGTGKTFGAHCIAKAMSQDVLTISAAEIQSSEPGGANRSIQEAFASAKSGNKILFIDECDSLIFDRSSLGMVLGSEVNTLLTEIEKFEGVCILATNRIDGMDPALERRIALIIEFPAPNQEQREEIWKKLIPEKMPLHKDVNIKDLAKHRLTGGLIKNSILQAARLAVAAESPHVGVEHFETALNRVKKSESLMGIDNNFERETGVRRSVSRKSNSATSTTSFMQSFVDEKEEELGETSK